MLFIVLFGLFVKYDDEFHKDVLNAEGDAKAALIAAQDAELTRNFACKYFRILTNTSLEVTPVEVHDESSLS